jgi:drug/metabolite transporter (DMT)-like permease
MSFAFGSMFFTHYARKFSSLWMNTFKAVVASWLFLGAVLITTGFHDISILNFGIFFISGFIALGIGDIFLVKAFSLIGPGRTMLLFGFQPVVVGVISYFVFDQGMQANKVVGILFFIMCLLTFSYESFKQKGKWEIHGLAYACLGMFIDGIGIIITRYAFDMNKSLTGFEGNFYRCLGAIVAYIIIRQFRPFAFRANFKSLSIKSRSMVTVGAFFGTFLSLAFYLEAIKTAQLATISGIAITSVIFASLFESIWDKKLPSRYLIGAFSFFTCGMYFILFK